MKRTALLLAPMLILMLSVLVGALFIDVGESTIPNAPEDSPNVSATIFSPKSGTYLTNPINLTVNGYCHYYPIGTIEYRIDSGPWTILYKHSDSTASLGVTETVFLNLSDGYHTVHAKVSAFAWEDFWYETFKVDTVPPRLSIVSPENKTYHLPDVPLNFIVYEPDSPLSQTKYSLDGLDNVTITGNTTLPELAVGYHNLTLFAEDEAGNLGSSETLFFTIEKPTLTPEPPLSVDPNFTLYTGLALLITILVVFAVFLLVRKHKH